MNSSVNPCYGRNLNVAFINTFLLHVTFNNTLEVKEFVGFEAKLLNALSSTLNFTFTLHETKTGFGTKLPNNTWTGVVGRLVTEEMDIGVSFLAETHPRRSVIDYSTPYYVETLNFFIGPQVSSRKMITLFLSPFKKETWIALLLYIIALTTILKVLCPSKDSDHLWAVFYVIGVVTTQGRTILIERPLSSFVLSFCLVPLTILTIYYGDELKASTSVSNNDLYNSLEKLAYFFRNGKLNLGVFTGTFIEDFVRNSPKSSEYGDLYRKVTIPMKLNFKNIPDLNENNLAIISPGKAFRLMLEYFGNRKLKIYKIEEPLFNYNIGIGFKKNFPCKTLFDEVIVALRESGCLSRWEEEMERPLNLRKMREAPMDNTDYIRTSDLNSTFTLWLSGLAFATLICCFNSYIKLLSKL